MLVMVSMYASSPAPAFSFAPPPAITNRADATRTVLGAKLDKIASSFDLDEILSNEREFDSDGDDDRSASKKRGRRRTDTKKMKMKEEMKRQKLEKQRLKKEQKATAAASADGGMGLDLGSSDSSDDDSILDYESLIQKIDFTAYEVPSSSDGKRIDAALAELLNIGDGDQNTNSVSISRSQCGTLLSHECVFVVAPENATDFMTAWEAHQKELSSREDQSSLSVPYSLIEKYGASVKRKSHALEPSSVLVYPSRDSLLSASSSSLLSNFIPPTEIVAQNIPLDVIYEDEHMIVINKRAGMVVHPAAGNWDMTVVNALAYYLLNKSPYGAGEFFEEEPKGAVESDGSDIVNGEADVNRNDAVTNSISTLRPGIVHRLDKGTTGVLVVAKTSSALATLSEAFAERRAKKQYLAVAIGNPGEDQWINKPIGRHPLHRQKMRVVPDPSAGMSSRGQPRLTDVLSTSTAKQGRPALSHIHTIHFDGKLSVVQVRIATGRTHQIRVHLQDHGTPIYGDDVYGLSDWNKALGAQRGITRPLLHAQRLEIEHPVSGANMVFEAEVADDMMGVIRAIWPPGEKIEF